MENLISKIYDEVVWDEQDTVQLGQKFSDKVIEMLEPLQDKKTKAEVEEIKELIYQASYYAGKNGFNTGVRFVVCFLAETYAKG